MASPDISKRASRLEVLFKAKGESKHIRGKSKPMPSADIKKRAAALQKLLGHSAKPGSAPLPPPNLKPGDFRNTSPAVWAEIWSTTEHAVLTVALDGFHEWASYEWVLDPVHFVGDQFVAPVGCISGPGAKLVERFERRKELHPDRPEAVAFCRDALKVIEELYGLLRGFISVPVTQWYPEFLAYPAPVAAPTPNRPSPFLMMTQVASTQLSAELLKEQIRARALSRNGAQAWGRHFGGHMQDMGKVVSGLIAKRLVHALKAVFMETFVEGVLATGVVPTFSPPFRTQGPVVAQTLPAVNFLRGVRAAIDRSVAQTAENAEAKLKPNPRPI